jgi:hypothetical protein
MVSKLKTPHVRKKQFPSVSELPLSGDGIKPLTDSFATTLQLFEKFPSLKNLSFVGHSRPLDESLLRRLGDEKRPTSINPATGRPWVPKPVKRLFEVIPTIDGLLAWQSNQLERRASHTEIFPNQEAFSRASGISIAMLREMKSDHCPGFNANGTIELFKWLAGLETWLTGDHQHDKLELMREGVASWDALRSKYQAKIEQLKHGELEGRLMDTDTAVDTGLAAQAVYFAMLDRLEIDFPARLSGRTAAQIKTEVGKTLQKIRDNVQKEFEKRRQKSEAQLAAQRKQDELVKT